jgi:hypothetical protein
LILKFKGRVVFQKLKIQLFEILLKEYHENEACFVFVNRGDFQIKSQTEIVKIKKAPY